MLMALKGGGEQPTRGTSPGENALQGVTDKGYIEKYY